MNPPREPKHLTNVDRRIWPIVMMVGFFGWLVAKEITMPSWLMAICAGIGALGLFFTTMQHPEVAFYLLVAYIPFSRVLVGDFGTGAFALNFTNILTIWVLSAYVLRRLADGKPVFQRGAGLNKLVLLFAALGIGSLISVGYSYGASYATTLISSMKQWLTPVFFYFVALWVVRDRRTIKTVVVLMMVTVTIAALMAMRDYLNVGGGSLDKSRIGGIAEQPNMLGAFFVYYMFLFLGYFLVYPKKFKTWMLLVPFLFCFRGVMVTFSRGAYLGVAAGLIGLCWHRNKALFAMLLVLIVFVASNTWMLPAGIRFRMGQTVVKPSVFDEEGAGIVESLEASAAHRVEIWRGAVEMIKDYPWWGVGYGEFPRFIGRYTQGLEEKRDAHNSYLLIAAEMGVPTLVVFLLVIIIAWWLSRRLYLRTRDLAMKGMALGVLAGIEGLLVVNMFGSRADDQTVASYFWILCGLVVRALLIEKDEARAAAAA